jgi:MYXO-CTERM domain-containing protein
VVVAVAALAAWVAVEHGAPALLEIDRLVHQGFGAAAAILLVAGAAWAISRLARGDALGAAPGLLLVVFAARRFDEHTKWALLVALVVLAGLALGRVRRRGIPA